MEMQVLKLGTVCRDRATQLEGTLTHWAIDLGQQIAYVFQPKGLDDEHQPIKRLFLCAARLEVNSETDFETVDVPFEILGTPAADKASGFSGMAIGFVRHLNGCFHVEIQPPGSLPKGGPIRSCEFDLRSCVGPMIPVLSGDELDASLRGKPSPTDVPARRVPGTASR